MREGFLVVIAIWSAAISVRAIRAVISRNAYELVFWESGLLNAGKTLSPNAVKVKAALSPVVCIVAIGMLTRLFPPGSEAWTILMVATIVLAVNDFVRGAKDA